MTDHAAPAGAGPEPSNAAKELITLLIGYARNVGFYEGRCIGEPGDGKESEWLASRQLSSHIASLESRLAASEQEKDRVTKVLRERIEVGSMLRGRDVEAEVLDLRTRLAASEASAARLREERDELVEDVLLLAASLRAPSVEREREALEHAAKMLWEKSPYGIAASYTNTPWEAIGEALHKHWKNQAHTVIAAYKEALSQ